jgi:multiple sugar transport system ATP-binding protein
MVFQSYASVPHKTVRQNIEFPLKSRKVPKPERRRQAEEAATLLGIGELLERGPVSSRAGNGSGWPWPGPSCGGPGCSSWTSRSRTSTPGPAVLTRTELGRAARALGVTFVYVTHDQVEAMTMGDRVAVLDGGPAPAGGLTRRRLRAPANLFVAGFVGSAAHEHRCGRRGDRPRRAAGAPGAHRGRPPTWSGCDARRPGLAEVVVGVRPEHLRLGDGSGPVGPSSATSSPSATSATWCAGSRPVRAGPAPRPTSSSAPRRAAGGVGGRAGQARRRA